MSWIIFLLIICWPICGLIVYLRTAFMVEQMTGDWMVNSSEDERFKATLSFICLGPSAYFVYRQFRREAEAKLAKRKDADKVRLLYGPSDLDDYRQCCELKQDILLEKTRLDDELAKLRLQPDPDAYVREYLPELATNASPAQVRQEQIAGLIEKMDHSLDLTEGRIGRLAEAKKKREAELAELRRREEAAALEAKLRQDELERQRKEAEEAAAWQAEQAKAEAKRQTEAEARLNEKLGEQARLAIDRQAAQQERQVSAHLGGLNVQLADQLWHHRSHCLNLGSRDYPDWIESVADLAVALQTQKKLRKKYQVHKRVICDWLANKVGDTYFASFLADIYNREDEPSQLGRWLSDRLRYAHQLNRAFEAELTRLKLAHLNEGSEDDDGAGQETLLVSPSGGEEDDGVLFSLKNLERLAGGK